MTHSSYQLLDQWCHKMLWSNKVFYPNFTVRSKLILYMHLFEGRVHTISIHIRSQNTVEASTYGSEFVAMRILVEMLIGLRYKLRMFGIPIDGPCNVFCDNDAVAKTTMRAETTLKKKNLSIAYHKSREAVACGIMLVFYERSGSNLSDLFTKVFLYWP